VHAKAGNGLHRGQYRKVGQKGGIKVKRGEFFLTKKGGGNRGSSRMEDLGFVTGYRNRGDGKKGGGHIRRKEGFRRGGGERLSGFVGGED